jgi:hypothetical protein
VVNGHEGLFVYGPMFRWQLLPLRQSMNFAEWGDLETG